MVDFEYKKNYDLGDFRKIIAILRGEGGCPWDREQTHASIRRNLLEEAYEVCEAIDEGDCGHLREELGDLLMQVIFHARIEEEADRFDLDDVADMACKKLINRHPHVFGNLQVEDSRQVLQNWDQIKMAEKSQDTTASAMEGVARSLPALWRSEKIQNKAKKVGFDWPDISGAMDKLQEELSELQEAIASGDRQSVFEELGDLLFSVVNVSRFAGVDPESALHQACEKFLRRFRYLEEEAAQRGLELSNMSLDQMEEIYQQGRKTLEGKDSSTI
ncbi:MAG TPA: nucleoside triphosphate pyrophosphohydrolase [Clostridiales bacterium]|nr:nucleoside triphosphate pyrophosphohydrolase [Clostridiales bacterium]